jgi:adenylosuccinate synthase
MPVDIVVGAQYGGEGKGKVSAYLAATTSPKALLRCGGPNSGHQVVDDGIDVKLRMVPTGAHYTRCPIVFPPGALIHVPTLLREAGQLGCADRLVIDPKAGIIGDEVIEEQERDPLYRSIGSTLSGTGYAFARRALRRLPLAKDEPALAGMLEDTLSLLMNEYLLRGERVLAEGHQAYGLSNYHGDYPYSTSRDTTAAAMLSELGLGPGHVGRIVMAARVFPTRNHQGRLPNELSPAEMDALGIEEYGGANHEGKGVSRRRVGRLDLAELQRAVWANTPTCIALTAVDYLDPSCRGETEHARLPAAARDQAERVSSATGVPVCLISTGPRTFDMVDLGER